MSFADVSLSLIVPVYNEERRLLTPMPHVFEFLHSEFPQHEVIYVDDGSKDQSYAVLLEASRSYPALRLLKNPGNMGKGFAIKNGFLNAKGDVLLFSDADFSCPIEESTRLLKTLREGYDIVIGSRALPDSNVEVHQAWTREIMGKTFNLMIRSFLPLSFQDTQCGFKMFRREAADQITSAMQINGFAFDVEMLVIAAARGLTAAEVPVTWRNVLDSRVHPIRNSLEMLRDVLRIRYSLAMGSYSR